MTSLTPHRDAVEQGEREAQEQIEALCPIGTTNRAIADLTSALQRPVLLCLADAIDAHDSVYDALDIVALAWASTVVSVARNFPADNGDPIPTAIDICQRISAEIGRTIHRTPEIESVIKIAETGNA